MFVVCQNYTREIHTSSLPSSDQQRSIVISEEHGYRTPRQRQGFLTSERRVAISLPAWDRMFLIHSELPGESRNPRPSENHSGEPIFGKLQPH